MKLHVPETDKALWTEMAACGIVMFIMLTVLPFDAAFFREYGGKLNLVLFQTFGYGLALQTLRVIRGKRGTKP